MFSALPFAPAVHDVQRWRRSFPGEPVQAAAVRRFTAALLAGCPVLDEVLLAVDELVVNAVRHTKSGQPGGEFAVEIVRWDGSVAVAVTDQGGPSDPVAGCVRADAESGRGLWTVSATADRWGWFGNDRSRTVAAFFGERAALAEAA
ncbi:ATP-binding protein [Spirillospora sp. NPDC052242]